MKQEFIPYQPSLDLKELGFNEPCFGFWSSKNNYRRFINDSSTNVDLKNMFGDEAKKTPTAPTFSQAFRWFREKCKIDSNIQPLGITKRFYSIYIAFENNEEIKGDGNLYEIYEEAELECLKKLIEIVKNK